MLGNSSQGGLGFHPGPARLMVADREMPGMDGGELGRQILWKPAFAQLRFFVLSAAPDPAASSVLVNVFPQAGKPADAVTRNRFVAARLGVYHAALLRPNTVPLTAGRSSSQRRVKPGRWKH